MDRIHGLPGSLGFVDSWLDGGLGLVSDLVSWFRFVSVLGFASGLGIICRLGAAFPWLTIIRERAVTLALTVAAQLCVVRFCAIPPS